MWGNTASGSTKYSGPQPGPTSAVARASQSNSSQKKPQQVLLGTVSAVWSDQAAEGIFQVGFENLQWCRWHSFCSTAGLSMQGKRFFPTFILFPSRVLLYAHCLSPSCDPPLRTAWLCFLDNLIKVIVEAVARSCTIKIIPPTDQISPAHWTTSQEVLQPQGHPDSPVLCVLLISHFFPRGRWGKDKNRTQHLNAFNKVANRSWQTLCFPPPSFLATLLFVSSPHCCPFWFPLLPKQTAGLCSSLCLPGCPRPSSQSWPAVPRSPFSLFWKRGFTFASNQGPLLISMTFQRL